MSLHHWRQLEMPPPLNLSWTSPAPTPRTMRAIPKIKPTETQIRISPIDPSAAAVTRPTTLTWNVLRRDAIHLVKTAPFWKFDTLFNLGYSWLLISLYSVASCAIIGKLWQNGFPSILNLHRSPHRETWTSFCCIRLPSVPQSLCWWMQSEYLLKNHCSPIYL